MACAKLLMSAVLLCSSPLEWGGGGGGVGVGVFSVHLYFCMFLLSVWEAVSPLFYSAIVKSDICYIPS